MDDGVGNTTEKQLGGVTGKGFMPGQSGNPNGRPKGAGLSITTEIKRKLDECPEGQKSTYLQLLIARIIKQAIQDGDQQMISKIWAYVDGMPVQRSELTGLDGSELFTKLKNIERANYGGFVDYARRQNLADDESVQDKGQVGGTDNVQTELAPDQTLVGAGGTPAQPDSQS